MFVNLMSVITVCLLILIASNNIQFIHNCQLKRDMCWLAGVWKFYFFPLVHGQVKDKNSTCPEPNALVQNVRGYAPTTELHAWSRQSLFQVRLNHCKQFN